MADQLLFECDLCGRPVEAILCCEQCMSERCEDCVEAHGCNCPPYVIG